VRSQDLPEAWVLNGAVYAARVDWLRCSKSFLTPATLGWVMPAERSVDVDTELDLALAEVLVRRA
jgi:N-acylneuraminate cytidylyltransferase